MTVLPKYLKGKIEDTDHCGDKLSVWLLAGDAELLALNQFYNTVLLGEDSTVQP